jgi:VanZ family protein
LSAPRNAQHFSILINWSLLILYAGIIFVLSSLSIVVKTPYFHHADKIAHAIEFGIFSILLYRAMSASFSKTSVVYLILITSFASIAYGALDEYHQLYTPMRTSDLLDLLADTIGVFVAQGIIVARVYLKL